MSDETPKPAPEPSAPQTGAAAGPTGSAPAAKPEAPAPKPPAPPPKPPADPAFLAEVEGFLGAGASPDHQGGLPTWRVPAAEIRAVLGRALAAGYDLLEFVSAIDRPADGKLDVCYALCRYGDPRQFALLAEVEREAPEIDSAVELYAGAEWHEREAYDMFGVVFRGHPFLRRILLDEDWPGHPLRKDYVDTIHDVVKRPY